MVESHRGQGSGDSSRECYSADASPAGRATCTETGKGERSCAQGRISTNFGGLNRYGERCQVEMRQDLE